MKTNVANQLQAKRLEKQEQMNKRVAITYQREQSLVWDLSRIRGL